MNIYIQRGNVIFDARADVAARLPDAIACRIADRFGYPTPVVLRTAEDLAAVIANNPFLREGCEDEDLHVYFLADPPDSRRVGQLDPDRSPPGRFEVRGREVYLRLPNGMGRTKLTNAYLDSKLATISTGRNWRTVTKLLDLMGG